MSNSGPLLPSGRRPYVPAGLYRDGEQGDWRVDATTRQFVGVHFADEGMAMSALPRGSMKASPLTGNTIASIKYLGGKDLNKQVEAAWHDAQPLKRLVENGDVVIVRIDVQVKDKRLWSAVYYTNEHTNESRSVDRSPTNPRM